MKLLSILLLLQVLLFQSAPALALLPAAACCTTPCEEEAAHQPGEAQDKHTEEEELCNPFGCKGCCVVLFAPTVSLQTVAVSTIQVQAFSFLDTPCQKSQWGIWHPPRLA